jgi:hypothetical protein
LPREGNTFTKKECTLSRDGLTFIKEGYAFPKDGYPFPKKGYTLLIDVSTFTKKGCALPGDGRTLIKKGCTFLEELHPFFIKTTPFAPLSYRRGVGGEVAVRLYCPIYGTGVLNALCPAALLRAT